MSIQALEADILLCATEIAMGDTAAERFIRMNQWMCGRWRVYLLTADVEEIKCVPPSHAGALIHALSE